MTYNRTNELIDKWWEETKKGYHHMCSRPEITMRRGPSNDEYIEITMRLGDRIDRKLLSPFYSFEEPRVFSTLDSMWYEIIKPPKVYAKDYDIYDSACAVAKYIDYSAKAVTKAFDNWCMSNLIKRVIFSDPCTIVIWNDGTKTIVRCTDEKFDKEKGLAMCIAKKSLGNKGKYYDVFKKWIEEEEK